MSPERMLEERDLRPAPPPALGDIPWGYGTDRVTAMAVDPYWVFAYWEVTDGALEEARARARSPGGACVLRVYDTTYRLFDGANANWHVDVPVHRPANNHYICVGVPGSTLHLDIGVAGPGGLATIARSGAVEMPRDSVSPDTRVEWMTVAPRTPAGPPYRHRYHPGGAGPAPAVPRPPRDAEAEGVVQALTAEGWTRVEWTEAAMGGRTVRWVRWTGPIHRQEWAFRHVEILLEGDEHVTRWERGERVVFGPWQVTVSGIEPAGARRTLGRWTLHQSWITESGTARVETAPLVRRILLGHLGLTGLEIGRAGWTASSEALLAGASEWRWLGASERRLGGASELGVPGASEWWWIGASERWLAGASERAGLAASEWAAAGASERQSAGGREWVFSPAAPWAFPGASEHAFPGASER